MAGYYRFKFVCFFFVVVFFAFIMRHILRAKFNPGDQLRAHDNDVHCSLVRFYFDSKDSGR